MGIFLFATVFTLALGVTHPPIESELGLFPSELSCRVVNLTIHLQLVPRLRMRGAMLQLPHTSPFCEKFYSSSKILKFCHDFK